MVTNEKNMTTGSPGKLIITFAIPLMLGNIFQQFYTMADTMIVGQVVGVEALAAVGAGDWLVWLVFGIMTGITQGFSILVAQFYGAREKENLKCAVAKSYIMTALLSVIVLAVSEGAVYHVLLFLQTPDNVIDLTMLYLRLIFAGIPIIAAYNIFAAILRALGNSRSPLIAMTVAALINVGLDLLFVAVFGWGVAGAAVATVIAQGFSALYCLMVLRKIPDIRLEKQDFYRQPAMSLRLLKVATPLAIQNLIISVGGLTVQYVVNGFGFLFVAGFTASNKLYGVLEIAAVSYGYAITTYVGQNLGAKKYQRIRKGVHSGTYMALLTSVVISGVMVLFGRNILSLFVSGEPEQIRQVLDIYFFLYGTPFIYQGQEIGMTNVKWKNINDMDDIRAKRTYEEAVGQGKDPEEVLAYFSELGRDNARTPMQWDDSENGGFTCGKPWIKCNDNYRTINVQSEVNDPDSLYNYYKRLIQCYHDHADIVRQAEFRPMYEEYPGLFAYEREVDGKGLLVIVNFTNEKLMFQKIDQKCVLCNYHETESEWLQPYEARIYSK